jgi:hypothetical protein
MRLYRQGRTEVSEKTLFQCRLIHHKCKMDDLGVNLGLHSEKATSSLLSYGSAWTQGMLDYIVLRLQFLCGPTWWPALLSNAV